MLLQLQLVLGVGGKTYEKPMAGVLQCEPWAKWSPNFYINLAFQCFQWKIK